jgi:hypothetical protein
VILLDLARLSDPPFLNEFVFNRVSVPHFVVDVLNVLFLARSWRGSTKVSCS